MGPVLLCDKSTIQTFPRSTSTLLHNYFWINVPPVLVLEVLGDLAKKHVPAEAQREVQGLAQRIGSTSVIANVSCNDLIHTELHGHPIRLDGRPKVNEGSSGVAANGDFVTRVSDDPCEHALLRWRAGDFSNAEELFARAWRDHKKRIHWAKALQRLKDSYSVTMRPKPSLDETLDSVDDLINGGDQLDLLQWLLDDLSFPSSRISEIMSDFKGLQGFRLKTLPYTHYCLRASLFAHFAMGFQLSSQKADNRIDLEYLFYLPFCNVFTTQDKFQRALAPYLLKKDQVLAPFENLAADLKQIADYLDALSPEDRQKELQMRGPPERVSSTIHQIWQKFMKPGFRNRPKLELTPDNEKRLMDHVKMLMAADSSHSGVVSGSGSKSDAVFRNRVFLASDPCPCRSGKAYRDCHGSK